MDPDFNKPIEFVNSRAWLQHQCVIFATEVKQADLPSNDQIGGKPYFGDGGLFAKKHFGERCKVGMVYGVSMTEEEAANSSSTRYMSILCLSLSHTHTHTHMYMYI